MREYTRVEMIRATTAEPLTLEELKDHLRMERGYMREDDMLEALQQTGRQNVEELTGRALMKQHRAVYYDDWSTSDHLVLPYPPLIAITSSTGIADNSSGAAVAYKDSTRGWNSFSSTAWIADTVREPGRLCLEYGADWPSSGLHNVNPIKIHYTCGYSTSSTGVPRVIRTAMKMMIGHWYEKREQYLVGQGFTVLEIPGAVKSLLSPYRVWGH